MTTQWSEAEQVPLGCMPPHNAFFLYHFGPMWASAPTEFYRSHSQLAAFSPGFFPPCALTATVLQ